MPFVFSLHSDAEGLLLRFGCKTPTWPPGLSGGLAESFGASLLLSEEQVVAFSVPALTQFCHLLEERQVCTLHAFMSSHTRVVVCWCTWDLSFVNRTYPGPCWEFCREWWGSGVVGRGCAQVVGKQFWIALCAVTCSWFWITFQCHVWSLGFSNIQ